MKKINYCFSVCFLFFFFATNSLSAQVKDAGVWTSIGVKKKISQAFTVGITQQFRLNENVTELHYYNTQAGLAYKINNRISFSANYRFGHTRRLDDSYNHLHRFFFDASYGRKFNKVGIIFRTRYQIQYTDIHSSTHGQIPKDYTRNMLTIKYNINWHWSTYAAQELWYSLNNPSGNHLTLSLSYIGINYKFDRRYRVNLYYLIQQQLNKSNPKTNFITGIGLTYVL